MKSQRRDSDSTAPSLSCKLLQLYLFMYMLPMPSICRSPAVGRARSEIRSNEKNGNQRAPTVAYVAALVPKGRAHSMLFICLFNSGLRTQA